MTGPPSDCAKPLSEKALRLLVSDLAGKIERLEQVVARLRLDNSNLHASNQALKDEIARLKNLPPRPPLKSSGEHEKVWGGVARYQAGRVAC
jgi:hypothetical protein